MRQPHSQGSWHTDGKCRSGGKVLEAIPGTKIPGPPWRELTFEHVLQYYDGPRLILRRSDDGQLYLAWWSDADQNVERWIYLPISLMRLCSVLTGKTPSRNALNSPEDGYVLALDVSPDTDHVIHTVKTIASAVPQHSIPLPGARLGVSGEGWKALKARLLAAIVQTPPYDYHHDTAEVSIPIREFIHLHRGLVSVASVIAQQLAGLEALGVNVVVGGNGPPPEVLRDYAMVVPGFQEVARTINSLPETTFGKAKISLVSALRLIRGIQCASEIVSKLAVVNPGHQVPVETPIFAPSDLDDWTRAVRIIEGIDSFIQARLRITDMVQATWAAADHMVSERST